MKIDMGSWHGVTAAGRYLDTVRIQSRGEQYLLPFVETIVGGPTTGGFGCLPPAEEVRVLPFRPNMVQHVWITDPELPCPGAELWSAELRLVRPDHSLVWQLIGYVDDLEALDHEL